MAGGAAARGPVELSFVYDEGEYLAAWRAFRESRPRAKFERALRVGFTAALIAVLALAADLYLAGMMAVFALFAAALNYYVERVRPRRELRRDPRFRDPYRVTFAEQGIHLVSKGYDAWLGWDFYEKALETSDFFFLVYGDGLFLLLPKRAFGGPRQEAALREMLRRKLGGKVEAHGLPAPESGGGYVPPDGPPDWR